MSLCIPTLVDSKEGCWLRFANLASTGDLPLTPHEIEYDFRERKGNKHVSEQAHGRQMIAALKQVEAGRAVEDVAREKHTIDGWKAKYDGMDVSQTQEAKQLRDENTRLRKLVADLSLDKEALQSVIRKNGWSS